MFIIDIINKIKGVINKMIGINTIENILHITPSISNEMINAIELWSDMYEGKAPWLHGASEEDNSIVKSLGLPQFIASEKARTALLEFNSEVTSTNKQLEEYLNKQYDKVKNNLRRQLEYGIAKGGLIIKPYIVKKDNVYDIEFDYIQANDFYPLSFNDNGELIEVVFLQRKIDKGIIYTRVEHHKINNRTVTVTNLAFKLQDNSIIKENTELGKQIPLSDVPEWANLSEKAEIEGVDRLMFAYFKMPEANTIDTHSPLGVSGFDKAKSLIEEADKQYSRLLWEFEGGELAIDVDRDALKDNILYDRDGSIIHQTELGKLQNRLYRPIDLGDSNTYKIFNPQFRDESLINGLNMILMRIEDTVGLSRGTMSDASVSVERTATELKILKQRSYQTNSDIQHALQIAIDDLMYVVSVYCDLYNLVPHGEYEISYEWDDSIITDVDTELETRLRLLDKDIISKVELRMWYFGETEQQAIEALEKINNNTSEEKNTDINDENTDNTKEEDTEEEQVEEVDKEQ